MEIVHKSHFMKDRPFDFSSPKKLVVCVVVLFLFSDFPFAFDRIVFSFAKR